MLCFLALYSFNTVHIPVTVPSAVLADATELQFPALPMLPNKHGGEHTRAEQAELAFLSKWAPMQKAVET